MEDKTQKIFIVGSSDRIAEFKECFPDRTDFIYEYHDAFLGGSLSGLVLDLNLDESPERLSLYALYTNLIVVGCAVKRSLVEMVAQVGNVNCRLVGINSLPTFINRSRWELSLYPGNEASRADIVKEVFGKDFEIVDDRVGMVTPRIICMIINEAHYVLQEGTASIEGVDRAMKLGTNYPKGPFDWADKIGLKNVYEVLHNLYRDTGDGRYKICTLLKSRTLQHKVKSRD